MKDKIEHKFKELLENQELPYNSAAWDSMRRSLDKKLPVAKPTNWYKWLLGGAAITVIAVSSYFLISDSNSSQNNKSEISKNQPTNSKKENKVTQLNKTEKVHSNKQSDAAQQNIEQNSTDSEDVINVAEQKIASQESNYSSNQTTNSTYLTEIKKLGPVEGIHDDIQLPDPPSSSKSVSVKNQCIGESQIIENKNTFSIELINQSSNEVLATIKPNGSINFEATTPGIYVVKAKNADNQFLSSSFEVKSVVKPSLEVESEVNYIKAIPTIKARSTDEANLTWFVNGKTVQSSNGEIEINPYKAGSYSIAVSNYSNGCKTENSQIVQIEEDYNLLAVNAFNPASFERKNQTFIPYALTQRDVKFTMIIIDPRDGGTVYKTSDTSQPWDGTDSRKGQQVTSNQSFIWKVQLMNPLPGEPSEYKGTITKL